MRNVICFEKMIPAAEPLVVRGVHDKHLVFRPASRVAGLRYLAALYMLEADLLSVFPNPMITAMFFVREKSRWSMFAESRSRGKATRASADDYDIVHLFFFLKHAHVFESGLVSFCRRYDNCHIMEKSSWRLMSKRDVQVLQERKRVCSSTVFTFYVFLEYS